MRCEKIEAIGIAHCVLQQAGKQPGKRNTGGLLQCGIHAVAIATRVNFAFRKVARPMQSVI